MRCEICGCEPCATPGFCNACHKVDADPDVIAAGARAEAKSPKYWQSMDLGTLWEALNHPKRRRS
jgi:hypothetical protein